MLELSILPQYRSCPREGHVQQVIHIFEFLSGKFKLTLYMDLSLPQIYYGYFQD